MIFAIIVSAENTFYREKVKFVTSREFTVDSDIHAEVLHSLEEYLKKWQLMCGTNSVMF